MRISDAFMRIAEDALLQGRPKPTIKTDIFSGILLRQCLEEDRGMPCGSLLGLGFPGMFAGIKIVVDGDGFSRPNDSEWREYFGDLADIWSAE